MSLEARLREMLADGRLDLPLPGQGQTAQRHQSLAEIGRADLSIARLAEAHVDAVAILAEAGRWAEPGVLYGVWASEIPEGGLTLDRSTSVWRLSGSKMFSTGAGIVDRALVTSRFPDHRLINVNLRANHASIRFDRSAWTTHVFAQTNTATTTFTDTVIEANDVLYGPGWYLERTGFWHGACGPASCWAGGALGLIEYACTQKRNDPHTLAHIGALQATAWALHSYLRTAGEEIDAHPGDPAAAQSRALTFRHLVEQACVDTLIRFGRAFGPRPLAFEPDTARRYQELELYIRQCHGERDLEVLGRSLTAEL